MMHFFYRIIFVRVNIKLELKALLISFQIKDSQDQNMIPPPKALEVLISRITSEAEDLDAMLVTGYPRSMRDVVEYMARVSLSIHALFFISIISLFCLI